MNERRERENFDYFDEHRPEPKFELLGGRLIVGNSLAGSRLLLDHILRGWSLDAAIALGPIEQWVEALCQAYQITGPQPVDDESLKAIEEKASRMDYPVEDFTQGEEGEDGGHWRTRSHLYYSLYEASEALGGQALGRDFVMRLGEDGFTPDAMFFRGKGLNTLYHYYLEGSAEIVFEIIRPAHRNYDLHIKREHYARASVPEYMIVDPDNEEVHFLRLTRGDYIRQSPQEDGLYRPQSVPGLAIAPEHLWVEDERFSLRGQNNPFIVERAAPRPARSRGIDDGLGWGELPFEARFDLRPVEINFPQYICWCPEAKFEFWDGRVQICSEEGVRNVIGMLLMTLGTIEACRFAPPLEWLAAIRRRLYKEARDRELRQEWRQTAMQAADILRSKYKLKRIAITGDLLRLVPLNYWSRLQLATWNLPHQDWLHIYEDLSPMKIDLVEADRESFQKQIDRGECVLEEI